MGNLTKNTITRGAVVALALSAGAATTANAAVTRTAGADRFSTATEIFKAWPTATTTAVLAAGVGHDVDALTVAPLAKMKNAPVILVDTKATTAAIVAQFSAFTTVYIANGTGVVSADVEAALKAANKTVVRLGGLNRTETALNIAKQIGTANGIVVANGEDAHLVDTLSIASIAAAKGMPIFLTEGGSLSAAEATYAKALGAKDVYALGGATVVTDAAAAGLGTTVTRLAGAGRYETNAKVVTQFKDSLDLSNIYVASGEDANLIDALAGAPLAGLKNAPILFAHNSINADVNTFLNGAISGATNIAILGGTGAVSDAVKTSLETIQANANVAISSVSAVGVKTVKVTFSSPVDTTKAVIKVKKGAAVYGSTVTWNAAKNIATLTTVVNLPAADYSVEVTGLTPAALTKAFTVAAEAPAKVEVTSTTVSLVDSATVPFKVSNQYGEDMKVTGTTPGVVVSAYNVTQKRTETLTNLTADDKLTFGGTFATSGAPAKLNDVIRITVTYAGFTTQTSVTVVDPAASSSIAFGTVAPLKDKARISVNETGLAVPYTMFDQYSVAAKLAAHTADADTVANIETISGVRFVSSNPAVVDVDSFAVDADGKLTFAAGATSGTAIITAVINSSGTVASFSVTVNDLYKVDTLAISAPTALVAAGETIKLDLSAADQFGVAIAGKDISGVTFTSSNTAVVANADASVVSGKLNVVTSAAGTTVLTAYVGTKVVGTVTVVVEAAAKATQVKSISFGPKFEIGATKTLTSSDFVVVDQYGRNMDAAGITFTVAEKTPADTQFAISGVASNVFTANVVGSSVMVLTATDSNSNVAATYEFTLSVIASADITSYAITTIPTMFNGALHAKTVELVGKTASGDTVVLVGNKITHATTSNASIATVVTSSGVVTVTGATDADGTAVIALWNGTTKLAETTVTLSKVAPVITTVKFNDSTPTALVSGDDLSANLEVKDQYGVAITDSGFWTTSDSAKATVSAGVITEGTMVAGDTVTIGYVTSNGLVVTTVLTK